MSRNPGSGSRFALMQNRTVASRLVKIVAHSNRILDLSVRSVRPGGLGGTAERVGDRQICAETREECGGSINRVWKGSFFGKVPDDP